MAETLNLKAIREDIPPEFQGWYDAEKYAASQRYLRESTRFELFQNGVTLALQAGFILLGGFAAVDRWARGLHWGMIPTGLAFTGALILLTTLVSLPFSVWQTFRIEARYGFNRTTPKTFIRDQVLGLVLAAAIGGPALAGILWFFVKAGSLAWVYAWAAMFLFQLALMYLAPRVIMPLFNKFTPLPEGDLRAAIRAYSAKENFALQELFTMDGSKRSARGNAFFTGFGRNRRVVLYDTLVERHPVPELVGVFAHEVGHFKLRHIPKFVAVSAATSFAMFALLSVFIADPGLYSAFGVTIVSIGGQPPLYAGLVFFLFLLAPLNLLLSLALNRASRKHEFEADAFAARTTGAPSAMADALRRLSVDNLSNLSPHPLLVALEYSHPPVLQRIRALTPPG
ncbi:MAG: M48 family metallopeptidase [Kiritimatiellia bacterium]